MFFLFVFLITPTMYSMDLAKILNGNNQEISTKLMYATKMLEVSCNLCTWVTKGPNMNGLKGKLHRHKKEKHSKLPCIFCKDRKISEMALLRHINCKHEVPLKDAYGHSGSESYTTININSVSYYIVACEECEQVKISKRPRITHSDCTKKVLLTTQANIV